MTFEVIEGGATEVVSEPIQLTMSNLGGLVLDVSEALPTLSLHDAAVIATYLDSIGYGKAPF